MAKPATEARLAAAAKGFTQVIVRGNAHIITKNPTTGKCCYDGQVGGGWHYGAGLETDTALEPDTDANYWKMVKALYNIKVRHEPELVTIREPTGSFTTYNGYVMVRNSTITLGDKIRINSTDYHAKRIEPQSWHDGTETYRIVYF